MQCKASRVIKCKDHLCASLYTLYNRLCYLLDAVGLSKFDLGNQKNEILKALEILASRIELDSGGCFGRVPINPTLVCPILVATLESRIDVAP